MKPRPSPEPEWLLGRKGCEPVVVPAWLVFWIRGGLVVMAEIT